MRAAKRESLFNFHFGELVLVHLAPPARPAGLKSRDELRVALRPGRVWKGGEGGPSRPVCNNVSQTIPHVSIGRLMQIKRPLADSAAKGRGAKLINATLISNLQQ